MNDIQHGLKTEFRCRTGITLNSLLGGHGRRLGVLTEVFVISSVISDKCLYSSTSDLATTASFHILSSSLFVIIIPFNAIK
jgi:hypothetical protein